MLVIFHFKFVKIFKSFILAFWHNLLFVSKQNRQTLSFKNPPTKQNPYLKWLTNVPFFITDQEGKNYQGITDEKGSCGRIKTNNKQTLDVLLGVMALEKWNGSWPSN